MKAKTRSSFVEGLFKNAQTGKKVEQIEEDDIIEYFKSRTKRDDAFFDQDKILNFADQESGLITRASFEQGITNEVASLNEELEEISEKLIQATTRFEAQMGKNIPNTECEKIFVQLWEKRIDSPNQGFNQKSSVTLSLLEFNDQKIHKRTYNLDPFNLSVKALFLFDEQVYNEMKLSRRRATFDRVNEELQRRSEELRGRLTGISENNEEQMLVHLGLICFESQGTDHAIPNDRGDGIGEGSQISQSRVQKDFESEDGSIYGYEGQVAMLMDEQDEEECEFRREHQFISGGAAAAGGGGAVGGVSEVDSAQFSFEKYDMNAGEEDVFGDIENEFMLHQPPSSLNLSQNKLKNFIGSQRQSLANSLDNTFMTPLTSQLQSQDKSKPNSLSRPQSFKINDFSSPRFNEELNSVGQRSGLDELQNLYSKTKAIDSFIGRSKDQVIAERNSKCALYEDLSVMDKQSALRLRILAKGIRAMHRLQAR